MVSIGFLFGGGAIIITFQQIKENSFLSEDQAFFGKPCFPNTLETKKASLKEDLGHWDPNGDMGLNQLRLRV